MSGRVFGLNPVRSQNAARTLCNFSVKSWAWWELKVSAGLSLTAVSPQPPQCTPSLRRLVRMASRLFASKILY